MIFISSYKPHNNPQYPKKFAMKLMLLLDLKQYRKSINGRRPYSDLYQINLDSDHCFRRVDVYCFLPKNTRETDHAPSSPCILMDQIDFSYFC